MTWMLMKKGTSLYVAQLGSARSYTPNVTKARVFKTRDEAEVHCCGNECIVVAWRRP